MAIPPGRRAAAQPKALDTSVAAPGAGLGIPAEQVVEILKRKEGITADSAARLAGVFHTSPEFWLKLQAIYNQRRGKGPLSS